MDSILIMFVQVSGAKKFNDDFGFLRDYISPLSPFPTVHCALRTDGGIVLSRP